MQRTVVNSKKNLPNYLQVIGQRVLWGRVPSVLSGDRGISRLSSSHFHPEVFPPPKEYRTINENY